MDYKKYKEYVKVLKKVYEEIGPIDWAEVTEKISELTSHFDDCISIEYNTDTSALPSGNRGDDIVRPIPNMKV